MMEQSSFGQSMTQPYCVGQATASMVHVWGQHPACILSSKLAPVPMEKTEVLHSQQQSHIDAYFQDTKENAIEGKFNTYCLQCPYITYTNEKYTLFL